MIYKLLKQQLIIKEFVKFHFEYKAWNNTILVIVLLIK